MSRQKNVLFLVIDQLRADCVEGALAAHVDLPNIRAFREESVSFTRHYSVANPCGPSRASLLTGQYAMNHRSVRNGSPLRHDAPNLGSEMRKAGYEPLLFGYTDTSGDPRIHDPADPAVRTYEYPMQSFREMVEMRQDQSFPWRAHLINQGYEFDEYEEVYVPRSPDGGERRLNDPAMYKAEDSDTAFLTNEFLNRMPGYYSENWFAHLTYIRPHPPFVAPEPYNDMYSPADLPAPVGLGSVEDEARMHPFIGLACKYKKPDDFVYGFPALQDTHDTTQALRATYLGLATEVDHHVGRVIDHLKQSGRYDSTMIVLTGDHGEMLGDHHSWGKQTVFDAAFHVPLSIRIPGNGTQAGVRISALTEAVDITPTILDWIGTEIPDSMDGRSLMPFVMGQEVKEWRKYTFSELDFADPVQPTMIEKALGTGPSDTNLAILRSERFTLAEFACDLPPILFDHAAQGEMENVAEKPEYAQDLARLTREMLKHRMRNTDHTLSMWMITTDGPKRGKRH